MRKMYLKTFWKKEEILVTRTFSEFPAFSPFPTVFSTLPKTEIVIVVNFNLLFANALNLVQSKKWSFGKG